MMTCRKALLFPPQNQQAQPCKGKANLHSSTTTYYVYLTHVWVNQNDSAKIINTAILRVSLMSLRLLILLHFTIWESLDDGWHPCPVRQKQWHSNSIQLAEEQHAHIPWKINLTKVEKCNGSRQQMAESQRNNQVLKLPGHYLTWHQVLMPVSHDFSVAYEYLQSSCSHTFSRVENHDMLETHPYPMLSRDYNSSQYQTRLRFFQRVTMGGWSMAVESFKSCFKAPIFPQKKQNQIRKDTWFWHKNCLKNLDHTHHPNARFSRFSHLYPLASKYPLHGSVVAPCSQRVDWGQPQYRCAHVEALRKPGFFKAKKRIQT